MAHPYLGAARRSAGSAAKAGYRPLPASAQPVPKANILDAILAETKKTPLERAIERGSRSPLEQMLERAQDDIDASPSGRLRRPGPSTAERLARIRLPTINAGAIARLANRMPGMSVGSELVWLFAGYAGSAEAVRPYMRYSGWDFMKSCTPPPNYTTGSVILANAAASGPCLTTQAIGGPPVGWPIDTPMGSTGHATAAWTRFAAFAGRLTVPERYATLEVYKREAGVVSTGKQMYMVPAHPARPARLSLFAPNPSNSGIRKGANRERPERKWFPEVELPRQWAPEPRAVPWAWLKHRPLFNPMRAPSERSERGPGPVARPQPQVRTETKPEQKRRPQRKLPKKPKTQTGPRVIVTPPGPPTRTRPKPGERESKQQVRGTKVILAAVNTLTEGFDYLDAFYDALPKHCKRTKSQRGLRSMRPQHKFNAVAQCWRELKWKDVIKNLIENEVEDRVFGGMGQGMKGLNRQMGRPVGVQTGAGAPGKVPKGTQMGKKPWDNWTDKIWP